MSERYVLEALQKAVTAAVAASSIPDVPVKYLGTNLKPPSDDKWIELIYIPNNIQGEFWGTEKTFRGVMRLLLHWKQDGSGAYSAMDGLQSVVDYFTKGKKLQDADENVTVTITEVPNIMDIIEQPPELLIPATIRYNFFKG